MIQPSIDKKIKTMDYIQRDIQDIKIKHPRTEKVNQLALLSRTYQMLYLLQPLSKKSIPTAPHSVIAALNPSTV